MAALVSSRVSVDSGICGQKCYMAFQEITMQLNTPKSIELGRQVHRKFGSWKKALEAAVKTEDGVYRIQPERLTETTTSPD
jgi:hypothetical protein